MYQMKSVRTWRIRPVTVGLSLLLLLCCCTSCGEVQESGATGLLSLSEIKSMEDSYLLSQEELFRGFSLNESDVDHEDEAGCIVVLSRIKKVHDLSLTPTLFFAKADPTGFYSVEFGASFDLDQKEAIKEVYDLLVKEAVALYGEPGQGPITTGDGDTGNGSIIKWKVGQQSSATLTYTEQTGGISLSIRYRLVIPGSMHDF